MESFRKILESKKVIFDMRGSLLKIDLLLDIISITFFKSKIVAKSIFHWWSLQHLDMQKVGPVLNKPFPKI